MAIYVIDHDIIYTVLVLSNLCVTNQFIYQSILPIATIPTISHINTHAWHFHNHNQLSKNAFIYFHNTNTFPS